jgi:membrane-bound lytic murein transglycosylase F
MIKTLDNKFSLILIVLLVFFSCQRINDPVKETNNATQLKQVLDRGVLRVVTDFNSTSYFIYRGQPMGYQYEMLQELADHLGVKLEVTVKNDLNEKFTMLEEGKVDLIAVNLTVTKERRAVMDFTVPHTQTRQVLVQRKPDDWKKLTSQSLEESLLRNQLELGGKTIFVQRNSSFVQRLKNLSDEIGDSILIREVDDNVEELIEKVANNEIDYTVCDEILAEVNESYYDNLDIATPLSFPQNLSWAVAKGSGDLKDAIDSWLTDFTRTRKYAVLYQKYYRSKSTVERLNNEFFANTSGKISPYDALIKEFSNEIGWDWRLVASMIYQESRFNPHAKSGAGAYGLMQLMPGTAERFGVGPKSSLKMQIRAGLLFIKWLNERLIDIDDMGERQKFILAAYNIGLGHVLDARALAAKNGKDPDIWDNNVAEYLLLKSDPKYYSDPVVKHGYCKGTSTCQYVTDILDRYSHYKNLIVK